MRGAGYPGHRGPGCSQTMLCRVAWWLNDENICSITAKPVSCLCDVRCVISLRQPDDLGEVRLVVIELT